MKKLLLPLLAITLTGTAQTIIYNESFEGTHNWTLNVITGPQGADPNFFTVSDAEGGLAAGSCGTTGNGNKTLHITSSFFPSGGASYDAGGLCGFFSCPQTNTRSESPVINCSSYSGLTLEFDFIAGGEGFADYASVVYFDGTSWSTLVASIRSVNCGGGQGTWTHYSVALPSSADNNPNVKIGFRWINNDDGIGTDPSLAVNDVVIKTATATLQASLASSSNISCFGGNNGSATVTATGGTGTITYAWVPSGGNAATASNLSAGTYTCTVGDGTSTTVSVTVSISQPAAITGSQSYTLCAGQSISVGSHVYSVSGVYTDTLSAQNGCDSILTTNLTVENPINTGVTLSGETITASISSAQYQWINCANSNILNSETNQSFTAVANGSYAVVITVNACSDTSACTTIASVGLNKPVAKAGLKVFPNPFQYELRILVPSEGTVVIYNVLGEEILKTQVNAGENKIDTRNLPAGIYFIKERNHSSVIKLVKD